jgi:pSer/pThr/pTyr-binding forkhead associated (FHA) protein
MNDPIEVLLKFAFLAVLYLFLLWIARSALRDLRRPPSSAGPGAAAVAGRASDARARLIVVHGSGGLRAGDFFEVGSGITIGRAPASEIVVDDDFASGRHARVYGSDGAVFLEDLNSTNGTFVNGKRVSTRSRLRRDDLVRVGEAEFRVEA